MQRMADPTSNRDDGLMLHPGERPTLKTISRLTGLAVATVSRALHDAPDLSRDTKKRVCQVAHEIGYRPNRAGVRLRTGKTNVISLVLATNHEMMNHTAKLISSVVGALRDTSYHMIVTPFFPDEDPMVPVRYIVETGSADAIILNQIKPQDPRVAYLMKHGFPFATHGRSVWAPQHAYFDFDNFRFAELAIEVLAERGAKNILLIAPPQDQNYAIEMIAGATSAAKKFAISFATLAKCSSDLTGSEIEAACAAHLNNHPQTDAIICPSVVAAMAAVHQGELAGHTIGRDMDIFAKEAIPFLTRFRRGILAVHEDVATTGEFLAKAVIQQINNPQAEPRQHTDRPVFVHQGPTGEPPQAAGMN